MSTLNKSNDNSIIYERIATIRMSRGERTSAIAAMAEGEQIAEAILNVAHVLRLLLAMPNLRPTFKPSFKH